MAPEVLAEYLRDKLGEKVLETSFAYDELTITVEPDALVQTARLCKDDPALDFAFWEFNCGLDYGEEGFALVTHLYSVTHGHHINIKTLAPGGRDNPRLPSLTGLYRGADWSEREAYDMFGIEFEGHPQLLPRLLTVENFEGFPLRKDFLMSTREAKPWPGAKEPEESTPRAEPGDQLAAKKGAAAPVTAEDKAAAARDKAQRAKEKAAAMRAQKAAERSRAQTLTPDEAKAAGEAEPGDSDGIARAADTTGGGDTEGMAAASVAAAAGEPEPQTPEGAAELTESPIAHDAAAGAVAGDVRAGAPEDKRNVDEPVVDPLEEAGAGQGAPPTASGSPGIEAEGRHAGADIQSGAKPASETPGMEATPGSDAHRQPDDTPGQDPDPTTSATPDSEQPPSATMGGYESTPGGDDEDVPVVPAPGSDAAPLADDRSFDDADERGGRDARGAEHADTEEGKRE